MTKSQKTGREREPEHVEKGSTFAKALFRKIGITSAHEKQKETQANKESERKQKL